MRSKIICGLLLSVTCIMSLSDGYAMPVLNQKFMLSSGIRLDSAVMHTLTENIRDILKAKRETPAVADLPMPLVSEDEPPMLISITPASSTPPCNNEPSPIGLLSSANAEMKPEEPKVDLWEMMEQMTIDERILLAEEVQELLKLKKWSPYFI